MRTLWTLSGKLPHYDCSNSETEIFSSKLHVTIVLWITMPHVLVLLELYFALVLYFRRRTISFITLHHSVPSMSFSCVLTFFILSCCWWWCSWCKCVCVLSACVKEGRTWPESLWVGLKAEHCSLCACEMEGATEELKNLGNKTIWLVSGWRRDAATVPSETGEKKEN